MIILFKILYEVANLYDIFRFRGNNVMTPTATNPANRRQIRPHGDW
jgi:hypothetical protein